MADFDYPVARYKTHGLKGIGSIAKTHLELIHMINWERFVAATCQL